MKFSFFIAKRYLLSKKKFNIINVISLIAIIGITFATASLFIILSVFNGFESLITGLLSSFDPDIKIETKTGKYFTINDTLKSKLDSSNVLAFYSFVLEENVVLEYNDKQQIATILGVDQNFKNVSGVDTMLTDGNFILKQNASNFAIVGYDIAYKLNISTKMFYPLKIWAIKNVNTKSLNIRNAFNSDLIRVSGIFSVDDNYNSKYVIAPLDFTQKLTFNPEKATAIFIKLRDNISPKQAKETLSEILGENFVIKDRYEQQETLFKIMKTEKWAIFFILSFIIFVSSFNIIASLIMLIIEKKNDIAILFALGASEKQIKDIFVKEGILISFIGAFLGIILGAIICFIQQKFGLITLPSSGIFLVQSYPVVMKLTDAIYVFLTVLTIGYLISKYPVRYITSKIFNVYTTSTL